MRPSLDRQYSLESDEWKNGAFTKALVEGMRGKAYLRNTGRITYRMLRSLQCPPSLRLPEE